MYKIKNLPYDYDELEPFIDTHTLSLHYNKHQMNYINKLNYYLIKNNYDFKYSLEDLPLHISEYNFNDLEDIMFNLGGVINHNLYFNSMSPKKEKPCDILNTKIINDFGSYEKFKNKFKEKALSLKGSGYTYLVIKDSNLEILNFINQDNPYNYKLIPLIALDMWEHSYYINYENKKDIYIDNFFDVIDFSNANNFIQKIAYRLYS